MKADIMKATGMQPINPITNDKEDEAMINPTPNSSDELLPCPFCGCKKTVIMVSAVHCDNCGACPISQIEDTLPNNIIAWNTRTPVQSGEGDAKICDLFYQAQVAYDHGDDITHMHLFGEASELNHRRATATPTIDKPDHSEDMLDMVKPDSIEPRKTANNDHVNDMDVVEIKPDSVKGDV